MWQRDGEIGAFFHNPVIRWKALPVPIDLWSCQDHLDTLPGIELQFVTYPAHSLFIILRLYRLHDHLLEFL